ncbi:MAG: PEP-CTERM sorting domain-containing protein [Fimbriimonadaceae bacterium]|nr:PEP-CTERM sorting domain-containing protein [Fimbriimonadaceae bacterium]
MKKFLVTALAVVGVASAFAAAPTNFVDLGVIGDIDPNYQTEDAAADFVGFAAGEIKWYKFVFGGTNGTAGYLDIDTINPLGTSPSSALIDTELGLYDSLGNFVATDDDDGFGLYSMLSFGNTTNRQFTQTGTMTARGSAIGQDGVLASGTYWLALGTFNSVFGASDWTVTGGSADADASRLAFRTDIQGVPEPASMIALSAGLLALARRRRSN